MSASQEPTPIDARDALQVLIKNGLTFSTAVNVFAEAEQCPTFDKYAAAAREYHYRDGEVEIDTPTIVSPSEDNGAYVMAWVWVTNSEAGFVDLGDGY